MLLLERQGQGGDMAVEFGGFDLLCHNAYTCGCRLYLINSLPAMFCGDSKSGFELVSGSSVY